MMKGRISSWSEHGGQFVSFQRRPLFRKDLVWRNAKQKKKKKKKSQQMPPYADMTEYLPCSRRDTPTQSKSILNDAKRTEMAFM